MLWAAIATLGGLAAYRFFHLTVYPIELGDRGADFGVFYGAARDVLHGLNLYPDPGGPQTYIYPPTLALLLVPLVELNATDPYFVFIALAAGALAVSIGLLSRLADDSSGPAAAVLGIVTLAAWPTHLLLRQGQVDSFTLMLLVGALWLVWRKHPHWAALALGAAISIKLTPGVLVVYFLWKRRYRLALESSAAAAAIVLASGVPVGVGDLATYVTRVLPRIGSEGNAYWYNQSLHSVFLRLLVETNFTHPVVQLGSGAALLSTGLLAALLLAVTLVAIPRDWPHSAGVFLAEAGAFMLLEVLDSSLSWQMHAVWLLVPVSALLLVVLERRGAPWWLPLAAALGALGFVAGPYEPPFEYGRFMNGWTTLLMAHTVAADLFLLACCLYVSHSLCGVTARFACAE